MADDFGKELALQRAKFTAEAGKHKCRDKPNRMNAADFMGIWQKNSCRREAARPLQSGQGDDT